MNDQPPADPSKVSLLSRITLSCGHLPPVEIWDGQPWAGPS